MYHKFDPKLIEKSIGYQVVVTLLDLFEDKNEMEYYVIKFLKAQWSSTQEVSFYHSTA